MDNKFTDLVVPGAPVNVSFSIRNARNNYSIPIAALYRDTSNNHFVWLLDPKTQTVLKKVVLIERIRSGRVFVSGDLDEDSDIVMHGGQGLANGQVVELVNS